MKRVLYITNLPAPYKIDFLNELGKYLELTVAFERDSAKDRDPRWKASIENSSFKPVWLTGIKIGAENSLDFSLVLQLGRGKYDLVLINGYSSLTEMTAIRYMRRKAIPFGLSCDGMFMKSDTALKKRLKQSLIGAAAFWLSPGNTTDEALIYYGADKNRIYRYPFTSVKECDIAEVPYDRAAYKKKVGCDSKYMILYVGQMIHRKGIDVLLEAVKGIGPDCKTYLVGGKLEEPLQNEQVVNIGFLGKTELADYYKAADVFVLPSREDIWGLVVNEAMACGTPVISTDKCGAALEMIDEAYNGARVPSDNVAALKDKISEMLAQGKTREYMAHAVETAEKYTIEAMANCTLQAIRQYW